MLQLDFDETQSAVRYCSSVEYNCLLVTPNPEKASKGLFDRKFDWGLRYNRITKCSTIISWG